MVPRKQIVKIGALFLSQFGLLAALNFQLFGMVTAYKMMELKRNLSCSSKAQVVLGYKWTHGPMVAKYDRGRCSRLVLEEKFSHV